MEATLRVLGLVALSLMVTAGPAAADAQGLAENTLDLQPPAQAAGGKCHISGAYPYVECDVWFIRALVKIL